MSEVKINPDCLSKMAALDAEIVKLNQLKIRTLFGALHIKTNADDLEKMLDWELITVSVPDRSMAMQLNRLVQYVPNLKFVPDAEKGLFEVEPGVKGRRVWKER